VVIPADGKSRVGLQLVAESAVVNARSIGDKMAPAEAAGLDSKVAGSAQPAGEKRRLRLVGALPAAEVCGF
jgi:hypothetical protein